MLSITVRRTLTLLNQLGAVQSINGVGSKILSTEDSLKNCDMTRPMIRKRLLDFVQSLQIFAMTCRACVKSIKAQAIGLWKDRLAYIRENFRYESVVFASLEIIPLCSPNQVIQEIYNQLPSLLLWGYPLRSMHGSREEINAFHSISRTSTSCRKAWSAVIGMVWPQNWRTCCFMSSGFQLPGWGNWA